MRVKIEELRTGDENNHRTGCNAEPKMTLPKIQVGEDVESDCSRVKAEREKDKQHAKRSLTILVPLDPVDAPHIEKIYEDNALSCLRVTCKTKKTSPTTLQTDP